ncbi:MAG TPA: phosphohydrolase [Deltaproteobacteria bacterium]|nr:phosphohydrolase [Deltaproteobacteria bacterium]
MYEKVRKEVERFFGEDARRIAHALEVTSHALRIQAVEGGDREVVTMASLLHDVGIKPAEERYKSSAGHYQEKLGPPVAEKILKELGVEGRKIATVRELIAYHHTPGKIRTKEFPCLWDADMIVNLREVAGTMSGEKIAPLIETKFLTAEGKRIARGIYLTAPG